MSQSKDQSARRIAGGIIKPETNCLEAPVARRAAILIDAEPYFRRLEQCLRQAQRSIVIIGWDFDARIRLQPGMGGIAVGTLLRQLVDACLTLEVHVLVWSAAVVHGPGASLPLVFGSRWEEHPRIHVKLDRHHPIYAAHHQKIICIDGEVAFVGGMDLTVRRWDDSSHSPHNEHRVEPDGAPYRPVHDVQMMVDGPAAGLLADVARGRWRAATGECLPHVSAEKELWPADVTPDFENVPVGICRTGPCWKGVPAIQESVRMLEDALRAARHSIYIETQYFTSSIVGRVLLELLEQATGPDIVVVANYNALGVLERYVMGKNRDRLARRLAAADHNGRFRIYYPIVPSVDGEQDLKLHSKVLIVDDRFIRIGSSNLNNRSEGLDTECDVAIEAASEADRAAIRRIRAELIGEHLGIGTAAFAAALEHNSSLIKAIEGTKKGKRCLRTLPAVATPGPTRPISGTWLLDPSGPLLRRFGWSAWRRSRAAS